MVSVPVYFWEGIGKLQKNMEASVSESEWRSFVRARDFDWWIFSGKWIRRRNVWENESRLSLHEKSDNGETRGFASTDGCMPVHSRIAVSKGFTIDLNR